VVTFDPRPRITDAPQSGFWLIRCVPRGPWCPAAIMRVQTRFEPGCPENLMDRSAFHCAFISGQPVSIQDVWLRRGRVISRSLYNEALAEIAEAVRANVYDPRCRPFVAVDIAALPIPFQEQANV
jgi:hypothetical protein